MVEIAFSSPINIVKNHLHNRVTYIFKTISNEKIM